MINKRVKMKTIYLVSFLFLFSYSKVKAQSLEPQVIGNAGTSFTNTNGSLEFTLGEPVTQTMSNGTTTKTLTNGFHQPIISISTNLGTELLMSGLKVYPVPATDKVMISFPNTPAGSMIELYNECGKLLFSGSNSEPEFMLPLSEYETGIYFLKVDKGNLFKIIKSN